MRFPTLELQVRRNTGDEYSVEPRFWHAGSGTASRLVAGAWPKVTLRRTTLAERTLDSEAYGRLLTSMLFGDERLRDAFSRARAAAEGSDLALQLSLSLDPTDTELHSIRWETLCEPEGREPLGAHGRLLLSRLIDSSDLTPLKCRPRSELQALVVVASPPDLTAYGLAEIDRAAELAQCQRALAGLPTTLLGGPHDKPTTLANLVAALQGRPAVLYLICHGMWRDGEVHLALDGADGVDWVPGAAFVARIAGLVHRPELIVLAACHGGTVEGASQVVAAIGPALVAAGVGAVVAMQGAVQVATVARAMPVFFAELMRDGQIDQAMAAARAASLDRPDWWMPVLYVRARDTRLWEQKPEPEPPFPRATDDELLIAVAPCMGSRGTRRIATELYMADALGLLAGQLRPGGRRLRLEILPHESTGPGEARRLGRETGATLVVWGELDDLRCRVRVEILTEVVRADPWLLGEWIPRDMPSPRAGDATLVEALPAQAASLACVALALGAIARGETTEAVALLDRAVEAGAPLAAYGHGPHLALGWRGYVHLLREDLAAAYSDIDEALALNPDTPHVRAWRGSVALLLGRVNTAIADLTWACDRLPPWHTWRTSALSDLAQALAQDGRTDEALCHYYEVRDRAALDDDRWTQTVTLTRMGELFQQVGKHEDALRFYRRALDESRQGGLPSVEADALMHIGWLLRDSDDTTGALASFEEARSVAAGSGNRLVLAQASLDAGMLYGERDKGSVAQERFTQAMAIFESTGSTHKQAHVLMARAQQADPGEAAHLLGRALVLLQSIGSPEAAVVEEELRLLGSS